ncbi:MAG: hypothetical protein SNH27_17865 [Rikenellaceae bacterium]
MKQSKELKIAPSGQRVNLKPIIGNTELLPQNNHISVIRENLLIPLALSIPLHRG